MESGESTISAANSLSLSEYEAHDAIRITHPALEIFHKIRLYQLYENAAIEIPANEKTSFAKLMRQYTELELSHQLSAGIFNFYPREIIAAPWLLKWFFHLMAVTSNCRVVNSCFHIFRLVIAYPKINKSLTISWYPSVMDIVAVLYNYGVDVNQLLKNDRNLANFEENFEEKLSNMNLGKKMTPGTSSDTQVRKDKLFEGLLNHNLPQVIKTLHLFLDCSSIQYSDEELACFLKILCITLLDRNFNVSLLLIEMHSIFLNLLSKITDTFWDKEAIPLAELLTEIANHHHNMLYLAKFMPVSLQGVEFQKLLCIMAIMKLTKTKIPVNIHELKPTIVLNLLNQRPLYEITDLYLLNSVTELVDIFIGNYPDVESRKTIQELTTILKETVGKIKESSNLIDTTKVKCLLLRVANEFRIRAQSLPDK